MRPGHLAPNHSNLASPDSPLCLCISIHSTQARGGSHPVDVGNALAEVEFGIFDGIAAFDFDEGRAWFRVALSTGERDVLASHVESAGECQHLGAMSWGFYYRCCPSGIVVDVGGEGCRGSSRWW